MMRPCVLVFAGSDPSGGAGLQADLHAIAAQGAHALTVVTAVTVQDNDRVYSVNPVAPELVRQQAQALINKIPVAAIKIGIPGSLDNARAIADIIAELKRDQPDLPVVLDPVLASGHGDALAAGNAVLGAQELMAQASIVLPNLPEAQKLTGGAATLTGQAQQLLQHCPNVLIKGGHGEGADVRNIWFAAAAPGMGKQSWSWPRLSGAFHGTGCTLASALAGQLAIGAELQEALSRAQAYVHASLEHAYAIAPGQGVPNRHVLLKE